MSDCEMKLEYNMEPVIKALASAIDVEFLTEKSKPQNADQVMQAAHHILKNIAGELMNVAQSAKHLALFARSLGFHEFLDPEKELDDLFSRINVDDDVKDILKSILKEVKKRGH